MNKPRIKIVEFYLKNFAPFYESMGLREFYFNKRDSPYDTTLIIAANGTGKSFLITELSPETLEHIVGRIAYRFIDGEDGEKRIHYIVNDKYEYVCTIHYDKNHKTTCFFKKIDLETGKEEELNPNGNVSSYQELCHLHLYYNKTYKNIGYITANVKNVITMSSTERQQLFSTWIPDTSRFLSSAKIVQKKINWTKKEIEKLVSDMTKISISSYKENLVNLKSNLSTVENSLLFYRDHISKINFLLGTLSRYETGLLKEHINLFKEKIKIHNKSVFEKMDLFRTYGLYLSSRGEKKLINDLSNLKENKAEIEGKLNRVNDKITTVQNAVGRIKLTGQDQFKDDTLETIKDSLSAKEAIKSIRNSLVELEKTIRDTLHAAPQFEEVQYSDELKEAVKDLLAVFPFMFQIAGNVIQSCNGFVLKDICHNHKEFLENQKARIKAVTEQIKILEDSLKSLHDHEKKMSKLSIDESFLSFIPEGCSENTCNLVKELKGRINYNPDNIQKEIEEKSLIIEEKKREYEQIDNVIKSIGIATDFIKQLWNIIKERNDKIMLLPRHISEKLLMPKIDELVYSINTIYSDLQRLDEYISLLEKKKAGYESVKNLLNIYTLMKQNDTLFNELSQYLKDEKELYKEREATVKELNDVKEKIEKLSHLNETIVSALADKEAIEKEGAILEGERSKLLAENQNLYYKNTLNTALTIFKNKESDLIKNEAMIKTEIEKCTSMMTSRRLLEERKETLEAKLRIYEILYAVWNPRTGYPSMLIKDFLDEVSYVTISSLDNIWGGLIRIKEFHIDENEFRIPIIRGNTILEDISECSTAEKNTLAMAISLAIIQVSTSYNVVRIDEVDGGFDEIRRQSFLDMMTRQLVSAGCEDSYIITHNQYFENVPCNVILLKGYELLVSDAALENKHVLYRYPSL
jgi:hypothetical protein